MSTERLQVRILGVVQGVGFRPFVHRLAHEHDLPGWVLNDGNGVKRVHPDGRIVWEYRSLLSPEENEIHTCQPLENGNVLIAENGPSRVIEVDSQGQVVKETPIHSASDNSHMRFRMCRKLDDGGFVLVLSDEQVIKEFDQRRETWLFGLRSRWISSKTKTSYQRPMCGSRTPTPS